MIEINNRTHAKINIKEICRVVSKFVAYYNIRDKDISIALVGEKAMRRLNKRYRGHDKPTDILSFAGDGDFFGEIIINYAQIKRQAKKFSGTIKKELIFILVHGLLHLLGYDDKTEIEKEKMVKKGKEFINKNLKLEYR